MHVTFKVLLGNPLPAGALSLEQYATNLCSGNPGSRITLAIEGLKAFMRCVHVISDLDIEQCVWLAFLTKTGHTLPLFSLHHYRLDVRITSELGERLICTSMNHSHYTCAM